MGEIIENLKKIRLSRPRVLVAGVIILIIIPLVIDLAAKISPDLPLRVSKDKEVDFAHTSLAFSEEPRISSTSSMLEIDLNINSGDNTVSGIKLELVFDPKVLGGVDIRPGSFLSNPTVISKEIDRANGKITYNIESAQGTKGEGAIAIISFSKLNNQETIISFLPQTFVTAQGFDQSVLRETVSAVIEATEEALPSKAP
ncbi:MAG: hypothetical protein HY426_00435 [Candidatus Levybacteria bacterium]|nr:hypothetical protein [Candidatus Levybacteria bacterium]